MGRRRDQAALSGPAGRDGPTVGPARVSRFATLPFVWLALATGLSGGFGLGAALLLAPLVGVPVDRWGPASSRRNWSAWPSSPPPASSSASCSTRSSCAWPGGRWRVWDAGSHQHGRLWRVFGNPVLAPDLWTCFQYDGGGSGSIAPGPGQRPGRHRSCHVHTCSAARSCGSSKLGPAIAHQRM